jgi:hypothetical protein
LKALDNWGAEPVSIDFDRRLYARLEERRSIHSRIRHWLEGIRWQPALPAAAVAAAFVLLMVSAPQAEMRERPPQQVEQALEDLEMLQQLPILEG